ncbi:hypothetical protein MLD38_029548 [Melastoma candidum]|uniref:Uncharacterized protein n=1 Tax=Melastoma candidum TaxID=119954 RepID=A0ACB9N4H2_9MYRT|nr:hypothetical protein MLD38_029548 [Melastoma candidum]
MMEWDEREHHHHHQAAENDCGRSNASGPAVPYVKVMTDEQLETLRKQIAVYASICEQLVEMHKNLTAQQDLAGVRLGNLYCDPLLTSAVHKITARQRWTPTPVQLQFLECIFNQGNGTPSKQKIKEITAELSQHGQISETNVYNWFQNRRARSKRKLQNVAPNNADSEADTEVESPKEIKTKAEVYQSQQNLAAQNGDMCFQGSEMSSELNFADSHAKVENMYPSDGSLRSRRSLSSMSFYNELLNGSEQLNGKMEIPGNYGLYHHEDDFDITG